jgi:holo-[acyl-carrier protein] synthase
MIIGIGIDVIRIERLQAAVDRHGERARHRLFAPRELADCDGRAEPAECLAARFAAKEAAFKALGTGKGPGLRWTDIQITRVDTGSPGLEFSGEAREQAERLGVEHAFVSLSHEGGMACAVVVLEGGLLGG